VASTRNETLLPLFKKPLFLLPKKSFKKFYLCSKILMMNNYELPPTTYPLPKVSKEIGESILADAKEDGVNEMMSQAKDRLRTNNPELYDMVASFMIASQGGHVSQEVIQASFNAMIMTHELLRKQGEADQMNASFNNPE
jgi:hypothetical protein